MPAAHVPRTVELPHPFAYHDEEALPKHCHAILATVRVCCRIGRLELPLRHFDQ